MKCYYLVDDIPVKVYYEESTKTLCADNYLGNPWPPIKAMRSGHEITEAEFTKAAEQAVSLA